VLVAGRELVGAHQETAGVRGAASTTARSSDQRQRGARGVT
jgi:hypothetical protein